MPADNTTTRPLAVDLDGTLIKSDLMQEAAVACVMRNPLNLPRLLCWLLRGRAHLKAQLARHAPPPQPAHLPYNEEFLTYLKQQRRPLVLATAAHRLHAQAVADHLGIFERVFATDGDVNLKGDAKAALLTREYGEKKFDYAGDSRADIAVWQKADNVLLVNAPPSLAKQYPQAQVFDARKGRLKAWWRALRPHQWTKNLLVFVAAIGGHQLLSPPAVTGAALAFVIFCLLASATYLINDALDLPHDRQHPHKRRRPLAAGQISVPASLIAAALLLIAAALLSQLLPPAFAAAAGLYVVATLAYSLALKRLLFFDVLALSLLFTLRIIAGGLASDIVLSFWLLAFSVFVFLSLAILKRHAELISQPSHGRAYHGGDAPIMAMIGAAIGMNSILVFALFINSDAISGRYSNPHYIWLAVPLMAYWLARLWILGGRGMIGGDPVLFAVRDRISWCIGGIMLLLVYLAI